MEAWIEFGRGPLFRLSFILMVLGLGRIFVLTIIGMIEALNRSDDKTVAWKDAIIKTFSWLIPVVSLWRKRPLYSFISVMFHIGLILVPLFLFAHVQLWKGTIGFSWFALPQYLANYLTLITIIASISLFLMRTMSSASRALSRKQDYIWPLLLAVPFLTGYLCANGSIKPSTYQQLMFIHIYSANLIMVMIPFTKIAHCVLMPMSQLVTAIGWKFPVGAGDKVIETLGYKNLPTWLDKSRVNEPTFDSVASDLSVEEEAVA